MVTGVAVATPNVVMGKLTKVEPCVRITVVETVARFESDVDSVIGVSAMAAPLKFNRLPNTVVPPTAEVADRAMLLSVSGATITLAQAEEVPTAAVMVATTVLGTDVVVIGNSTELPAAGTETVEGTPAAAVSLVRPMVAPLGVGPVSTTSFNVLVAPAVIVVGLMVMP